MYVESDILNAISTILKPTSLLEKRNAIQKKLNSSELPELSSLKSNLSALIDSGKLECQDIESLLADPELLALLESDKPAALIQLKGNNNLDEMLNNLFKYAKNLYQSGDYKKSAELLGHVSNLVKLI